MNTLKKLEGNILDAIADAEATRMASTLDKALNSLVEIRQHQPPDESFYDDYYRLERLRTAIRQMADGAAPDIKGEQPESIFTIDTTGKTPVWSFPIDVSDGKGNIIQVSASFNPQPLIEVVQSATVPLIIEQLQTAVELLKKAQATDKDNFYLDAVGMIQWIAEGFQKGDMPCQ